MNHPLERVGGTGRTMGHSEDRPDPLRTRKDPGL